jgi:hypothetical protein
MSNNVITIVLEILEPCLLPRFSSPSLQKYATENGLVLTGYGSGNSVAIEKSTVVSTFAQRVVIRQAASI